ncbi:MAG TPA: hypothetical protein VMW83_07710 [Spirochaetia bacterium]|nr:hypothetical protein [Spirochaetia bacterium]
MEPLEESLRVGWLTEERKDLIAAGLFVGLCLVAWLSLRFHHIPIDQPVYKTSILKDFTRDLFIFKPY